MNTEFEMNMNSVERILQYTRVEQEAPAVIPTNRPPTDWPTRGAIEFKNLCMFLSL